MGIHSAARSGFDNPIPAVKRKRQPQTSVAGGRADEESTSGFNALDYRS